MEHDWTLATAERIARGRDATLEAMRAGADVVFQAALFDGRRLGYADFLRRVERPSDLGEWSYEVWDTKLARHAKASASAAALHVLGSARGVAGASAGADAPRARRGAARDGLLPAWRTTRPTTDSVARDLEALLDDPAPVFPVPSRPEPVEHCGVCAGPSSARAQWRAEDDLSLVANLTSRQRRALHAIEVTTRTALAEPPAPLPDRLDGAGRDALARIRAQAQIQVRGEREGEVLSERIAPARDREGALVPNAGLLMLPEPSPGDLFFDIEGDPFFASDEVDGIEYLFGVIEPGRAGRGRAARVPRPLGHRGRHRHNRRRATRVRALHRPRDGPP